MFHKNRAELFFCEMLWRVILSCLSNAVVCYRQTCFTKDRARLYCFWLPAGSLPLAPFGFPLAIPLAPFGSLWLPLALYLFYVYLYIYIYRYICSCWLPLAPLWLPSGSLLAPFGFLLVPFGSLLAPFWFSFDSPPGLQKRTSI